MGPSRIGTLPLTRWWDEVVDLIAHGANVSQVTDTTLWAAQKALGDGGERRGVRPAGAVGPLPIGQRLDRELPKVAMGTRY